MAALDWKVVKIEDVAEKVGMGPFGSSIKVSTFVDSGVPVISGQHLRGFRLEDKVYNFISNEHAEKLRSANVYRGDVIFTHAGNIGQVAYIPEDSKFDRYVISQRQFFLRCDKSKVLPEYIVYFFKSPIGQHKLLANRSQTGVPSIARPVSYLRTIEFPLPSIAEQKKIVSILTSLENKLQTNAVISSSFEEIGHALFKHWFVDFEFPNESGEPYRSSGGEMVDSELGEIPKGWIVVPMTEIIEVNSARKLGKGTLAKYLDMGNMPTASYRPSVWVKREYASGSKFMNGDTLLARITPCLENGKTAFVDFLEDGEVGWGSTEYIVLRSKPPLPLMYSYFLARSDEFRSYAFSNMTGSSGRQRVPTDCLEHYLTVRPPAQISSKFGDLIEALRLKASSCGEESRIATQMRDILLPKLLSGELVPTK